MDWLRKLRRQMMQMTRRASSEEEVVEQARMVESTVRELETELMRLQAAVAEYTQTAHRYRVLADEAKELAQRRRQEATTALVNGDERLAQAALADGLVQEQRSRELEEAATRAETQMRELRRQLDELQMHVLSYEENFSQLVARADLAQLQKQVADLKSGIDARQREFDRLAETVQRLEVQAQAHREVAGMSGTGSASAQSGSSDEVEARLAALRRQLGMDDAADG